MRVVAAAAPATQGVIVVTSSLRDSALDAACNGFDVFPIRPRDKRPLVKGWQRSATHDLEAVERVWHEHPEANVGIRTGHGLVVLEADSPTAEDRLHELELPRTTSVRSSRGVHFYLRGEAPTRAGVLPDIDVRGRGRARGRSRQRAPLRDTLSLRRGPQ